MNVCIKYKIKSKNKFLKNDIKSRVCYYFDTISLSCHEQVCS